MDAATAAQLLEYADRVRRLSPPSRRHPDRFTEAKDEVADAMEALVRRSCPGVTPLPPRRRTIGGVRTVGTMVVGGRRVMVQRRVQFALG